MSTFTIVMLVILIVLIIACIVLYFLGKRAEKKQAEQQEQLAAVAQTVSMLIIDKGQLRLKDALIIPLLNSCPIPPFILYYIVLYFYVPPLTVSGQEQLP